MKKIIALALVCLMALSVFAGCGANKAADGNSSASDASASGEFKTFADVVKYDSLGTSLGEKTYVYVFDADGVYYRAVADLPDDVAEELNNLDYAEEYDGKVLEIVSPLKIARLDNLSEAAPSQDELDKYVGKTGQELLDDGWTCWGCNLNDMEFTMNHGDYSFAVMFDAEPMEMTDEFEQEEAIKPLAVKSITYLGIGDATNIEE